MVAGWTGPGNRTIASFRKANTLALKSTCGDSVVPTTGEMAALGQPCSNFQFGSSGNTCTVARRKSS